MALKLVCENCNDCKLVRKWQKFQEPNQNASPSFQQKCFSSAIFNTSFSCSLFQDVDNEKRNSEKSSSEEKWTSFVEHSSDPSHLLNAYRCHLQLALGILELLGSFLAPKHVKRACLKKRLERTLELWKNWPLFIVDSLFRQLPKNTRDLGIFWKATVGTKRVCQLKALCKFCRKSPRNDRHNLYKKEKHPVLSPVGPVHRS